MMTKKTKKQQPCFAFQAEENENLFFSFLFLFHILYVSLNQSLNCRPQSTSH